MDMLNQQNRQLVVGSCVEQCIILYKHSGELLRRSRGYARVAVAYLGRNCGGFTLEHQLSGSRQQLQVG